MSQKRPNSLARRGRPVYHRLKFHEDKRFGHGVGRDLWTNLGGASLEVG